MKRGGPQLVREWNAEWLRAAGGWILERRVIGAKEGQRFCCDLLLDSVDDVLLKGGFVDAVLEYAWAP